MVDDKNVYLVTIFLEKPLRSVLYNKTHDHGDYRPCRRPVRLLAQVTGGSPGKASTR